ncbi:MAG TPA: sel1 repeat family protein, partial [Polyangiaceae bacterium]|nr:sel1 repeat family protein [Polyangiaceae bacterium]
MSSAPKPLEQLELEALELELEAAELAALGPVAKERLRVEVDEAPSEAGSSDDDLTGDPELDALGAAAERALAEAMAELEADDEALESERAAAGAAPEPAPDATEPITKSLDDLIELGDVDGLLALARAHRLGIRGKERDLGQCYQALSAAAELGSAEAAFRSALFHLSGVVVPGDVTEGLTRLRAAAKAGSERARLYLANVYELGIGRDPAPDKAGVWYRGVARALGIEVDEEDPEYIRAMAELGSI